MQDKGFGAIFGVFFLQKFQQKSENVQTFRISFKKLNKTTTVLNICSSFVHMTSDGNAAISVL